MQVLQFCVAHIHSLTVIQLGTGLWLTQSESDSECTSYSWIQLQVTKSTSLCYQQNSNSLTWPVGVEVCVADTELRLIVIQLDKTTNTTHKVSYKPVAHTGRVCAS